MIVAQTILKEYDILKRAHQVRLEAIERDRQGEYIVQHGTATAVYDNSLPIQGTAPDGTTYYLSSKRIRELAQAEAGPPPDLREIVESYADGRSDAKVKKALKVVKR